MRVKIDGSNQDLIILLTLHVHVLQFLEKGKTNFYFFLQ